MLQVLYSDGLGGECFFLDRVKKVQVGLGGTETIPEKRVLYGASDLVLV